MKTLAFFNCANGVGATAQVYHLAWMYAELGVRVVVADLDPQANLTSLFLEESRLEERWSGDEHSDTIAGAIRPFIDGDGDIQSPHIEEITQQIGLLVGDLQLARTEENLSSLYASSVERDAYALRVISAFYRLLEKAALAFDAEFVLMDVGPNLGAINRSALIAADYVAVPLAPDLFSLQGLRNLGPTLREWREQCRERLEKNPSDPNVPLPAGSMEAIGYIATQHAIRQDRPTIAYNKWMDRIPSVYREAVLGQPDDSPPRVAEDPHCLAQLKHYRSLMPMAMEARKPMFLLKPADGAIGAHTKAVSECYRDFRTLACSLADRCGIALP